MTRTMSITILVLVVIVALAVLACIYLIPRNGFLIFSRPGGSSITLSRSSISFDAPPDHYATNGFDHIEAYIGRFLTPSQKFKSLGISTPDGNHALGFTSRDGKAEVFLSIEWRQEPQRETAIRSFFKSLGIAPKVDYLADNGGNVGSTRCLEYPITGDVTEVSALTKRMLQELCGVSPADALDFDYRDK